MVVEDFGDKFLFFFGFIFMVIFVRWFKSWVWNFVFNLFELDRYLLILLVYLLKLSWYLLIIIGFVVFNVIIN